VIEICQNRHNISLPSSIGADCTGPTGKIMPRYTRGRTGTDVSFYPGIIMS